MGDARVGDLDLSISPRVVDATIKGTLGSIGGTILDVTDFMIDTATFISDHVREEESGIDLGKEARDTISSIMNMGGQDFINPESVTVFYDTLARLRKADSEDSHRIEFEQRLPRNLEQYGNVESARAAYESIAKEFAELRKEQREIHRGPLSREEKDRQIDALNMRILNIARGLRDLDIIPLDDD